MVTIVSNTTEPNMIHHKLINNYKYIIIVVHTCKYMQRTLTWASQHIHAVGGEVSLGIIKVWQNKIKSILEWNIKSQRCISNWSSDPLSKFNVIQQVINVIRSMQCFLASDMTSQKQHSVTRISYNVSAFYYTEWSMGKVHRWWATITMKKSLLCTWITKTGSPASYHYHLNKMQ